IPALLVSTAAAVLVTKDNSESSLGTSLLGQVSGSPRAATISAGMVGVIGLLPGMPAIPFLVLAGGLVWVSRMQKASATAPAAAATTPAPAASAAPAAGSPEELAGLLQVDRI